MKKTLLAAAMAIAVFASVPGCSSDESSANSDIIDATSSVESYRGVLEINMSAASGETEISMGTKGNISLQADPFFADMDTTITAIDPSTDPIVTNTRIILDENDGVNTVYLHDTDNKWYKEVIDTENFRVAASQYDVMENGSTFMRSSSDMKSVGTDTLSGKEVNVYEGTVPKEVLSDVLELTGSTSLIGTNIGQAYYEDCEDLPITVWVDSSNVIVGYEVDLTDTVQNLFNKLYEENNITDPSTMLRVESYTARGTVDEYNCDIDRTLPQEAIEAEEVNSDGETVEQ